MIIISPGTEVQINSYKGITFTTPFYGHVVNFLDNYKNGELIGFSYTVRFNDMDVIRCFDHSDLEIIEFNNPD